MNSSLFLCYAHLYASAVSLVRGFCPGQLSIFVAVLCRFVPFPKLSGGTSGFAVAGCRTPWKRFIHHRIATQITMIRLMPFCRFVKEKRPFTMDFFNFWILYQYFPQQPPPPYSLFLLLLQEYLCPPSQDTLCLGHRFHQTHRCGSTQGFPRGEAGKNRLSRDDF